MAKYWWKLTIWSHWSSKRASSFSATLNRAQILKLSPTTFCLKQTNKSAFNSPDYNNNNNNNNMAAACSFLSSLSLQNNNGAKPFCSLIFDMPRSNLLWSKAGQKLQKRVHNLYGRVYLPSYLWILPYHSYVIRDWLYFFYFCTMY